MKVLAFLAHYLGEAESRHITYVDFSIYSVDELMEKIAIPEAKKFLASGELTEEEYKDWVHPDNYADAIYETDFITKLRNSYDYRNEGSVHTRFMDLDNMTERDVMYLFEARNSDDEVEASRFLPEEVKLKDYTCEVIKKLKFKKRLEVSFGDVKVIKDS